MSLYMARSSLPIRFPELMTAALWDNEELLLDLLNGDLISHINSQDSWGRTPLHAAATTENSKCLNILLKAGANPNIASGAQDNFKTPLHVCAEHGFLQNVQKLVEAGADVQCLEGHGCSPIDLAERGGHIPTYEFLKTAADNKEEARESFHYALRDAACNGDVQTLRNLLKDIGKTETQSLINMTPNGTNTLLFKASEGGNRDLVELLLESGADGRVHPVTKYSPLYIAAYYGHKEIVSILLKKFPGLVQVPTVEKWLPIHACCINGHVGVMDMLLKHEYPPELMITFRHFTGDVEYDMPFDINLKDVSGQNALYIACQMGNQRLVDTLLKHKVESRKIGEQRQSGKDSSISRSESVQTVTGDEEKPTSPTKKRLSEGIQGILQKLSLVTNQNLIGKKTEHFICPIDINAYCEDYQTALHVAVKQRSHVIASSLLNAKSDPNLPILPASNSTNAASPFDHQARSKRRMESSTALVEACLQRDLGMIELLLKYGARDDDCKAMAYVCKDDIIVGKILALKAHQDSENKINLNYINETVLRRMKKPLLVSSILPSNAVTVNWHSQKLDRISEPWLVSAALKINPRLRLCPRNQSLALHAITRIDLSSNSLEKLPPVVWTFCSLKYLNLSQNRIERLEFPETIGSVWLEELLLQENRFESVPEELFTYFPSLTILNIANNKLQSIPPTMWTAMKLQELNLSLNLLTELPALTTGMEISVFDSLPYMSFTGSPEEPMSPDFVMVDFQSNREKFGKNAAAFGSSYNIQQAENRPHTPPMTHNALWRHGVNVLANQECLDKSKSSELNSLVSLNLAHNSFHKIPKVLACLGTNLQRLNLSYNNLKFMGHIGEYPATLRQLDLSHNRIERWFYSANDNAPVKLTCFALGEDETRCEAVDDKCMHKRHMRLESLKTLLLSGNLLKTISVGIDESLQDENEIQSADLTPRKMANRNLWFPNVTMIDLSENTLKDVTARIAELSNLSVLNLSGNADITDLPPQMGLLNRMWNLNTTGCILQEPLKSMIESKRCKTMDIIGYLKSVLEDAKPYSRMKLMVVGIQGIGKTSLLNQLRQEGSQKPAQQDHWAKRMGATTKSSSQKTGKPISTVGVDIGSWVLDMKASRIGSQNSFGPVIFRTWDFGGQREYYATHLYFLSRRSLYLVVWNICDGEKGLNEIVQWLVNIQARAPNSPVIIVGTHYDLVSEKFPPGYLDYLQTKIRDKFIYISDPEKRGLPRVMYSIEISCKTRHNIKQLCAMIYETVFNIKTSNGKRLLEQKIPSKYIHLEEIVAYLATDRKSKGLDPVVNEEDFKIQVSSWMEKAFSLKFRDDAEIMQACSFLHENGVLLHYEDSTLRDLYFLDPQWLCDMLAHVVTVREINPFAKNGIMKIDDLKHLFKGQSSETRDYVLSLLSKFELAVPWDYIHLLIPSLLPSYDQMRIGQNEVRIRVPVRSRGWALKSRANRMSRHVSEDCLKKLSTPQGSIEEPKSPPQGSLTPTSDGSCENMKESFFSFHRGKVPSLNRFLLLSYFPSGFWPRLISRILSDDRIVEIVRNYFSPPPSSDITQEVVKVLDQKAEWCCWQSGMELSYGDLLLLRVKEVTGEKPFAFMLRRDDGALCETDVADVNETDNWFVREDNDEQVWDVVDLSESGLLEIHIPALSVVVNTFSEPLSPDEDFKPQPRKITLEPAVESLAKLLALTVDHVDTLLEDWYPSIGTRFVHTSEGKYLVTRLIPCPRCYPGDSGMYTNVPDGGNISGSFGGKSPIPGTASEHSGKLDALKNFGIANRSPRMSSDSGVGHSPGNTRVSSVDSVPESKEKDNEETSPGVILFKTGNRAGFGFESRYGGGFGETTSYSSSNFTGLNFFLKGTAGLGGIAKRNFTMYSWSVEYCILHSQKQAEFCASNLEKKSPGAGGDSSDLVNMSVKCPKHGDISLEEIAPDILFMDLNFRFLLKNSEVQRGSLLGRGAFGFVFGGKLVPKYETKLMDIAIKMFQPIDPGQTNHDALAAYKAAKSKWFRAPAQSACRAYIAARGEVRVLYWVAHTNIVPFVGLCQSPLSIIMPRAPKGALDTVLSDFRRSGDKVSHDTIRVAVLQIGKALEYLHSHRIIYRDLKAENVLVWRFPNPFGTRDDNRKVDVKLADYGISRSSFPTGSKGFGGTEGFMAPEIIRYNGEEEYTEKVDIFSFGMLLYEMISLKQPFDGCENVKESILEGMRPSLTQRDCDFYPLYILDLMVVCWSHIPRDRPSASQIVSIASSPEFTITRDIVQLNVTNVVAALGIQYGGEPEVWASCSTGGIYCLKLKSATIDSCHCFDFITGAVTAMCRVDDFVWMGDTMSKIHVLKVNDYSKTVESDLESQVGYVGAIVSIKCIDTTVAVAFSSGRLFLCSKTAQPLTELGNASVIHCLSSRSVGDGVMELWAGERAGQMNVFTIKDGVVSSQENINHYERVIDAVEVLLIDTHVNNEMMFSYVYPGSVIYGWDCEKREMISRLDVGKLLPVKESIEEELNSKPLQVTVLRSTLTEVFVGTNRGFVFCTDVKHLRPITSFRPFTEDVRSFWVFREQPGLKTSESNFSLSNKCDTDSDTSALHSSTSSSSLSKASGEIDLREKTKDSSKSDLSADGRESSPTPSHSDNSYQVIVALGKGNSNLIEKNIGNLTDEKKQRRRAFAMLWFANEAWEG
ncbi:unnamed protein product [Orchesella dallaii]|uniref:non-specific serine/threonine protein kinase n=1 Tax=Orchesella dallaii TaxID=48710 RepID=A0ABP1R292_9HEXA